MANIILNEIKVLFIGPESPVPTLYKYLTRGKYYDVAVAGTYYIVNNDMGQTRRYKGEYFLTTQQVRDKKLNELGI